MIFTQSVIPRCSTFSLKALIAIEASAITCTCDCIKLCISPSLENASQKLKLSINAKKIYINAPQ